MKTQADTSTVPFTNEMFVMIDEYRKDHLLTWNDFYRVSKISSKGTMDHWKKSGRITFKAIQNLSKLGIDLVGN